MKMKQLIKNMYSQLEDYEDSFGRPKRDPYDLLAQAVNLVIPYKTYDMFRLFADGFGELMEYEEDALDNGSNDDLIGFMQSIVFSYLWIEIAQPWAEERGLMD